MPAPALVLFDIDGTLVRRAGPEHGAALVEAVTEVAGQRPTLAGVPVAGMLDTDIGRALLAQVGESAASLLPMLARAEALYAAAPVPDLRARVCPGVRELLTALDAAEIPVGLVTGNLPGVAWRKMERAGLRQFLRFGAFAGEGATRADLVKAAVDRARSERWIDADARVTLIGDHPNDVRAARGARVRIVSVMTGPASGEELAACGPDALVADLTQVTVDWLLSAEVSA